MLTYIITKLIYLELKIGFFLEGITVNIESMNKSGNLNEFLKYYTHIKLKTANLYIGLYNIVDINL